VAYFLHNVNPPIEAGDFYHYNKLFKEKYRETDFLILARSVLCVVCNSIEATSYRIFSKIVCNSTHRGSLIMILIIALRGILPSRL
jgi:hypothetical protein